MTRSRLYQDFRRMLRFSQPYLVIFGLVLASTTLLASAKYGRAYLMKPLLDDVIAPQAYETHEQDQAAQTLAFDRVWVAAIAIALAFPVGMVGRNYGLAYGMGRIRLNLQEAMARKLLRLPLAFYHERERGDLITRALQDVEGSRRALGLFYGELLESVIMVGIGLAALVAISWQLSLATLVVLPAVAGVLVFFGGRIQERTRCRQSQLAEVNQRLLGILSGTKVIKAFQREKLEARAFAAEAGRLFRESMRVARQGVISHTVVETLTVAATMAVILLATALLLAGKWGLTGGDIAAFAAVLGTTYRPIKVLSRGWPGLVEALVSAERLFEILDAEEEAGDRLGAVQIREIRDSIVFDRVSFSYGETPVLREVSLEAHPGEVIAVIGRSGAGKTTLTDLLFRFIEPDSGAIRIDGIDVRDISRSSLLDRFALVTQEPFLFDAPIWENIRYGRLEASDAEVHRVARAAHVDEFVRTLAEGYGSRVGELGLRLSGGQRQRIAIARALLKDPALLVFDEATSALDSKTESVVQGAIEALREQGRTIFVIAHRMASVRSADRIVVLENGRVAQYGPHSELIRERGLYRELSGLQGDGIGDETRA